MPIREALNAFFASDRLRLLHLVVPPHVYGQTRALIRALAEHGARPCPLRVLPSASFGPSRGWPARARILSTAPAIDGDPLLEPLDEFARAVVRERAAIDDAGRLGLVLAPQHIDDRAQYERDVEALIRRPDLAGVRWIALDAAHANLGDLAERLGDAARAAWIECEDSDLERIDRIITELHARRSSLGYPPIGSSAGDEVRRMLADAEASTDLGEVARRFQALEATLLARGLHDEVARITLRRIGALLARGDSSAWLAAATLAIKDAEQRGMTAILPEALRSLGRFHVARNRHVDGLEAFGRAAESAKQRGDRRFAADMQRCVGHAALNANRPRDGREAWARAFELLDLSPPVTLALDAPQELVVLGVSLADAFEAAGDLMAARDLRGHATAIEQNRPRDSTLSS